MGPTVAIWLTPQSRVPAYDDLMQLVRRLDQRAESAANFRIIGTAAIPGAAELPEPRPFGLVSGKVRLDEENMAAAASLLGFTPEDEVHAFAYMNAPVDHRVLGELALFLARELAGFVDFGGNLGPMRDPEGTLFAVPYAGSTVGETFHLGDARFLEWWLRQPGFHMVK